MPDPVASWHPRQPAFLAAGGLAAVLAALLLRAAELGPLSHHMGAHLLLMNVLAPLLALAWADRAWPAPLISGVGLLAATTTQLIALWAIHVPSVLTGLTHLPVAQVLMHAALFMLALWFWMAVVAQRDARRWRALVSLLATGKLACLLGVLLVFAPRALYPELTTLADQQQAGLWMIAACLLTYVVAAVVIAGLWLKELGMVATRASPARRSAGPA